MAGAKPVYLNCSAESGIPDFDALDEAIWRQCQVLFICSPHNPTGAVIPEPVLVKLMELADRFNFVIAADECYSEIYFDEEHPPVGLLEAASRSGRKDFRRCVVFHSLSKRSNAPGLRSGFVAGDAGILEKFLRYRTYHGCAMPLHHQVASRTAWQDEAHVRESRREYQQKFSAVLEILDGVLEVRQPEAGFYLWARTPLADERFTRELFARQNITVLPGSYLSREVGGVNPGADHIRMALVADIEECIEAANRIVSFLASNKE